MINLDDDIATGKQFLDKRKFHCPFSKQYRLFQRNLFGIPTIVLDKYGNAIAP
jgi:hypothetical protein